MKRISSRWMTLSVVLVIASQCCCCIVTPVSGDFVQAGLNRSWADATQAIAAWFE